MSDSPHTIHGACLCGRNRYTVAFPTASAASSADVHFDSSSTSRRAHASPVITYLLVPIPWYASATYAYYPDETHSSIRRVYHSSSARGTPVTPASQNAGTRPTSTQQRHFCGFCGTHFSSWEDESDGSADGHFESARNAGDEGRISVAVETLLDDAIDTLIALRLWPEVSSEDEQQDSMKSGAISQSRTRGEDTSWSEEMIEHSAAGKVSRRRGVQTKGSSSVEWEIVELDGDQDVADRTTSTEASSAKRKLGDVEEPAERTDAEMR